MVSASKVGRNYTFAYAFKDHLCHPSVRHIEGVKREALLFFKCARCNLLFNLSGPQSV